MNPNELNTKAEVLYAYLRGKLPTGDPSIPAEEAATLDALRQAGSEYQPDLKFQARLQARLLRTIQNQRPKPLHFLFKLARGLAIAMLAVVLILGMSWAIRNLLPQPGVLSTTSLTRTAEPSPTEPDHTATPQALAIQPTDISPTFSSSQFPGEMLVLQAAFPTSPPQAKVFLQDTATTITVDEVHSLASRLGLSGYVYQQPGENAGYIVTDGTGMLSLDSSQRFLYVPDSQRELATEDSLPPLEQQVAIAEQFLKDYALLDFPYRVEFDESLLPGTVRFLQLLDGLPVRFSIMDMPHIDVQIASDGNIRSVDYNHFDYQEVGIFPIRTAEQAWQKVTSSKPELGIESSLIHIEGGDVQSWQREYPLNQHLEIFGYLQVLQPAEPGISPFITLNNVPLIGNTQGLAETPQGRFMHLMGIFQTGAKGERIFQVESWQESFFKDENLSGVIQRQGASAFLATADQRLLLPDLPSDVPQGVQAQVGGVVLTQPQSILEWSWITIGGGGGGGGGGGSSFFELNLEGVPVEVTPPTMTPMPTLQPGTRLDGLTLTPLVTIFRKADGSERREINAFLEPGGAFPEGYYVRLEGSGAAGVEAYHQLTLRVWGMIGDTLQQPVTLLVERYEPVYPGLQRQAWQGKIEIVTIQGVSVLRLTDLAGEQYILSSSIDADPDSLPGQPDDLVIIEGVAYPDKSFGGFPVITDSGMIITGNEQNLAEYPLATAWVQDEPTSTSRGNAVIEKIELVYHTTDLRFAVQSNTLDQPPYIQPIWRFSGHYEDGTIFEILVQALQDAYLK